MNLYHRQGMTFDIHTRFGFSNCNFIGCWSCETLIILTMLCNDVMLLSYIANKVHKVYLLHATVLCSLAKISLKTDDDANCLL